MIRLAGPAAWLLVLLALRAADSLGQPRIPTTGPVTRLEISDTVDHGLAAFVKRVLAEKQRGEVVLLELNTLGGRLDSAVAIRDALLRAEATTVCWVNPRAISAGAMIALACDVLALTPDASLGAATPVALTLGGDMAPVEEKMVSYVRIEMANTAAARGRPREIAEAMVDADVEIPGLDEKGKLLTLNADQAFRWKVAEVEAATADELWRALGRDVAPHVERVAPSAAEIFARFLSQSWVAMLLIGLGLLGIAVEVLQPQGGAAAVGGLLALGLFFFGHHVVNLAGAEEIALFVLGLVLLAIEWWLPGNTVFGAIGFKLVLVSLALGLLNLNAVPLRVAWGEGWIQHAVATVGGGLLASAVGLVALLRFLPSSRFGRHLILQATIPTPRTDTADLCLGVVGMAGKALTDLRPVGRVEVRGRKLDARVEYSFVRSGSRIRVLRAEGELVVVREEVAGLPADQGAMS